ncbi:hypothetical protein BVX99_03020, partial [bacterium F16]
MTVRLDGLQSGMDTTALIQSLIDAERIPFDRKEDQMYKNEQKIYAWSKLDTKLTTLNSKAVQLNTYSTWQQKTAGSTTESVVTATANRDAANGTYAINVTNLAQSHRIGSTLAISDNTAALGFSGDFTLGDQTVTIGATDSLNDVRDAINDAALNMAEDKKVNATIIGNTLVLERDQTGNTDMVISETAAVAGENNVLRELGIVQGDPLSTGTFSTVNNLLQESKDLAAQINGVDVAASVNTELDSLVEGVTFNFKDAGSSTLTIGTDKASIKSLITDFITAYNEAMELSEEASSVNLGSSSTGEDDAGDVESLGLLQGDLLVGQIRFRARQTVTALETDPTKMDQDYNTLTKIGIWTEGQENRLAVVDEDKLDDALENHWDEVEDLFRDFDSGIMRKMVDYTDGLVSTADGTVVQHQSKLEAVKQQLER